MSTVNSRSSNPFVRRTSHSNGDGIKTNDIRSVILSCQSILASGRHHFSAWVGSQVLGGSFIITDKGYFTKVTPSPNASYLQLSFMVQQVSSPAILQAVDDSANARNIPAGLESNSLTDLQEIIFEYAVTGGVETDIYFMTDGDYLVKGLTVTDSPASALESGDTGYVDLASVRKGKDLTVSIVQGMISCQDTVLANCRKVHVNMAGLKDDSHLEAIYPYSYYANYFDTALTAYAQDTAPGFWVRPGASYYGDRATRLKCRVKAKSGSGTGYLKFVASGNTESDEIAVTSVSTPEWYTAYIEVATPYNYQFEYAEKIEIFCKDETPSSLLYLHNIVIEEMDGLA